MPSKLQFASQFPSSQPRRPVHRLTRVHNSATKLNLHQHSILSSKLHNLLNMRQRITFIQQPEDSVDPETLKITKNSISTSNLKAAREDRITFGFDELPQELYRVLKASHELHMRWVSEKEYASISPMVSRVSPGLHVFYTPQKNSNNS